MPELNTTLAAFGNQLINQLTAQFKKMAIGSRGAGRRRGGSDLGGGSGTDRSGGGWVGPSKRKCYNLRVIGHISRHCLTSSEKGTAGSHERPCSLVTHTYPVDPYSRFLRYLLRILVK